MWKLISYSNIKVPLEPFKSNYSIGIIENENGIRRIVQIDRKYSDELKIGVLGKIETREEINGLINIFVPDISEAKVQGKKVALITGSSRGIGRTIALELAKNEFNVVINNRGNENEGLEIVDMIKNSTDSVYIKCDISDPVQVSKMIEQIIDRFGRIDVLINNAGITKDKRFENMDFETWNEVISINLTGAFNCSKAVVGHMQERGGGHIINISSVIAEIGNIGQANYAASKGGLISLTKALAKEYACDGIYVNSIAPGFIKTRMTEKIPAGNVKQLFKQIPLGRFGTPEEVAAVVKFLVVESTYITGQVINVNGGLYM